MNVDNGSHISCIAESKDKSILGLNFFNTKEGHIYFLPPATKIPIIDSIKIILKDIVNFPISESPSPDWVKNKKVPNEDNITKKIGDSQNKINIEQDKISELQSELNNVTKFKKLLYAEDDELEQIVLETFKELKVKNIPLEKQNKEDGIIDTKYGKGILEIKKASKSASRKHTRELDDWVGDYIEKGEEIKGILIINHYGDSPIKERKIPFPQDVIDHAKKVRKNPFCLLTTLELFNAYCKYKEGKIKSDEIIKKIFEADGSECKLF